MTEKTEAPDAPEKFDDKTLRGDIRDAILSEFKTVQKPWQQMTEWEQGRLIHRARDIADKLVRQSVDIIASNGLPSLPIKVGKFTVDGSAIKGTFEAYAEDEALLRIRKLSGTRAMFVLASPDAYQGERKEAETDNVGDLAIPRTGPGAPSDPDALAQVGRGNGKKRGRPPKNAEASDNAMPPAGEVPSVDVSNPPFNPTDDDMRVAEPMPDQPAMLA